MPEPLIQGPECSVCHGHLHRTRSCPHVRGWPRLSGAARTYIEADYAAIRSVGQSVFEQQSRRDYLLATAGVSIIVLPFVLGHKSLLHWFLLPTIACGILAGVDLVRWLRGRLELFDPMTMIACVAFYGFFLTPVLHVTWNYFGVGNDMPLWGDWRPWLGGMAALNAIGLLVYRLAQHESFRRTNPSRRRWKIDAKKFYPLATLALASSIAGVLEFISQFGGIPEMIRDFEYNREAFAGKGWLLVFAWPLAVLSFITLSYMWSERSRLRHPLIIGLILVCTFGIVHFVLMGWYGSRSATVWALFWMAGIIHYRFRKFSRRAMAAGVIFLICFMYFYGFYKERGRTGLEILSTPANWFDPEGFQRNIKYVLLEDLARADVTAYLLHNMVKGSTDYDFRWGLTYLGALSILIPRNIWPDRPSPKVEAGTQALWGKGAVWPSSRMYGLNGEAMLNFGPLGIIPLFAIFGTVVGWFRRKLSSWSKQDSRMFLAPFFVSMVIAALVYDSDVLVFFMLTEGALICTFICAASRQIKKTTATP